MADSNGQAYKDVWGETADYEALSLKRNQVLKSLLESPTRYQSIHERQDRSDTSLQDLKVKLTGKYFMQHRGCALLKSGHYQAILNEVFWYLRPATIIELGTYSGGNAIWMADKLRVLEVDCQIYSMDINPSLIEPRAKEIKPTNVTFLEGDNYKIEKTFPSSLLQAMPHPWLVLEDAHENVSGVMEHFLQHMKTGDYFIVEDTSPLVCSKWSVGRMYMQEFEDAAYEETGPVLLNELKEFLKKHDEHCKVDSFFTDFFGYNCTDHWHGFIRRM